MCEVLNYNHRRTASLFYPHIFKAFAGQGGGGTRIECGAKKGSDDLPPLTDTSQSTFKLHFESSEWN